MRSNVARRLRVVALAALAALAAGALAACGGDDDDDDGGSTGGANIDAAQELIDQYSQKPAFEAPGEPFDARQEMQGKKVMSIPISSEIPITQVLEQTMADQAERIGFQFKHWQNQGNPDQWIQGINNAISQGFDVVDLVAIDPSLVKPQIDKAREAGIKVISTHFAGFSWEPPPYIDGAVRIPYREVGQILAAWAIVQTDGEADSLAIIADDLESTKDVVAGLEEQFEANCPDCELETANVPTTEWATGVQNEVANGIRRDPNVNYLIPIYDAMTQFATAGVQVAGKAGEIEMDTFNGTPFALELVADGKVQMNLGENEDWIGRAMIDASMRAAAGLEVPSNDYEGTPLYIFTEENVADAGTPPKPDKGYGEEYRAGFDELWGLSP